MAICHVLHGWGVKKCSCVCGRRGPARACRGPAAPARPRRAIMQMAASNLCDGLDGAPLCRGLLGRALTGLLAAGEARGEPLTVTGAAVVAGTENRFPTSHSGVVLLATSDGSTQSLFVKKVTAVAMAHKPWADRQRTLKYIRTELRFYQEFAPRLAAHGVPLPRLALAEGQLAALGDTEVADPPIDEPSEEALRQCGAVLFLEPVIGFEQASPLPPDRALVALAAVARFHAAAWEDAEILSAAAKRLQRHGGAFSLSIRNPKELTKIEPNWAAFVKTFTPYAPELFAQPSVAALGSRLAKWSGYVSEHLSPKPDDTYATLIHGDFKSLNVFLPPAATAGDVSTSERQQGMLIDFASTGVGLGMSDVAMLLQHGIVPADLADGGEERLIDGYLAALADARGSDAPTYPREVALRHYRLGLVDYGRFVVGRFWTSASPDTFAAKADNQNVVLVNRNVEAALGFVARMDKCLAIIEAEGAI